MLTKNTIKQIQLLKTNKGRIQEGEYIIEGKRCVLTYINNNENLKMLFMTKDFLTKNKELVKKWRNDILNIKIISKKIMKSISNAKSAPGVLGICNLEEPSVLNFDSKKWLYLDQISDPGNLGTLIRTAAWFNIKNIALSRNSVDPYNSKVVRSAVGAHTYSNIHSNIDFDIFENHNYWAIGADQNSKSSIENIDINKKIIIVLGSETKGISQLVKAKLDEIVSISKLGYGESLNVSVAGSILMYKLSKKQNGILPK